MGSIKSRAEKILLGKALKQNKRIPVFVAAKTNRRVIRNSRQRHWRRIRLKLPTRLKRSGLVR